MTFVATLESPLGDVTPLGLGFPVSDFRSDSVRESVGPVPCSWIPGNRQVINKLWNVTADMFLFLLCWIF
jgi:hypothetical protein